MSKLLAGLAKLGLGHLEDSNIYEEHKTKQAEVIHATPVAQVEEKDLVYDKTYECPICDSKITTKVVKSGKAKLLHTDRDLRAVYEGIDTQKYDVVTCPLCGFSALGRYFVPMPPSQKKAIREGICMNVHVTPNMGEIYTHEEALERYKLALACALVKPAKASEKAYICLKSAWLLRGYAEELSADPKNQSKIEELKEEEKEYLENAYEGFCTAKSSEGFPMCGMDEMTVDYLIAVLAYQFEKYDVASKLVASILTSRTANARTKDKARELKDDLMEAIKKTKGQ